MRCCTRAAKAVHRQIYDVYANERLPMAARDSLIEVLTDYYLSRKDYAFTASPKSMALMDNQPFSQVFRRRYPAFNGLIWAYHWLQVGLYEPLVVNDTPAARKAGMQAALARFWSMLEDPPASMPSVMPMTAGIAPEFSRRHPRAAMIFDNLHMMHDIISDILANESIPYARKGRAIAEQLAEFRDPGSDVTTVEEWQAMAEMMGLQQMGGPSVGLIGVPTPKAPPDNQDHHHQAGPFDTRGERGRSQRPPPTQPI